MSPKPDSLRRKQSDSTGRQSRSIACSIHMMITFCTLCKTQIPLDRQRRRARTCNQECQKLYRKLYNEDLASRKCKYCSRRIRSPKSLGVVLQDSKKEEPNVSM
jgi:hypothetical protein